MGRPKDKRGRTTYPEKRQRLIEELVEYINEHGRLPRVNRRYASNKERRLTWRAIYYFGRVSVAFRIASEEYSRRYHTQEGGAEPWIA